MDSGTVGHEVDSKMQSCRKVIVVGYGPVGRVVTERLRGVGIAVKIVELNQQTVDMQLNLGHEAVYGNVSDPNVLHQADVNGADALILTIPDQEAALNACTVARRMTPDLYIGVRMNHTSWAMRATAAGANHVTIEELVTAEAMQSAVMDHLVNRVPPPDSSP